MAHEGVPLVVQRQLGHANLGIISIYLQGGSTAAKIISTVHRRLSPTISASAASR